MALIGPNGTGKTTLGRIIAGDLAAHDGAVTRSGGLGVMRQFVGSVRDDSTVRDLLLSVAPEPVREAAAEIDRTETLMMERDSEADQMAYAHALVAWGDVGGYDYETLWDVCTVAAHRYAVRQGPVAQGHHPLGRGAEAGGPRGAAARARGGAAARRAGQLPRRAGQALAGGPADRLAQDRAVRQPRPRAAQPGGDAGRHPRARAARARPCGCTRAGSRPTTRPARTGTPGSRSCAGAGTRSTRRSRTWCRCSRSRPSTTTAWPRATTPPRPGCASSRRPGRRRRRRCGRTSTCGSRAVAPPSGRSSPRGSS